MNNFREAERTAAQWDSNARTWNAILAGQLDAINEDFGIPRFLDFLGDPRGRRVLDAGCGEGRSSRHLAGRGALVTGVDLSPAMIAIARERETATPLGIGYQVASSAALRSCADRSFDLVTSIMALMDTAELAGSLREFSRVLKPGGELAVMVRHPCFFTTAYSLLANRTAMTVAGYFHGEPYRERLSFPATGAASAGTLLVTRYPHTLTDYLNGFLQNGFILTATLEPRPCEALCRSNPRLRFWQQHAALYLFLRGRKSHDSQESAG